jgi:UDP-glucose 4-epimerase
MTRRFSRAKIAVAVAARAEVWASAKMASTSPGSPANEQCPVGRLTRHNLWWTRRTRSEIARAEPLRYRTGYVTVLPANREPDVSSLRGLSCLVPGGAGYIGSHIVAALQHAGAAVTVLDNFYSGQRWAVGTAELVELDLGDGPALEALFDARRFDAMVHCAAHIWVGESTRDPGKYYRNNTANTARLADLAARAGLRAVVFSSTAAVYGEPSVVPISERAPLAPINPYGASKAMAERIITDIARAHGQRTAVLRYFNVAGAHDDGHLGEATPDNSHLVKVACQVGIGRRPVLRINGTDYPTPDGTCIRDYIHVQDLAEAHVAALAHLLETEATLVLNCGYGHGFSVREVLDAFHRVTGVVLPIEEAPRRPGDPAELVAANDAILATLDWRPRRDDLARIIASAWAFEQRLAQRGARAAGS